MEVTARQARARRLAAHYLDRRLPAGELATAAGACGIQNSPPGAWETALFQRVEDCTLEGLRRALWEEKSLLQAWSFRGAPVVFPAGEEGTFLFPLAAREGENPWIYTRGISAALDHVGMDFASLLALVAQAARVLEEETVQSKEALDRRLAALVEEELPAGKRAAWNSSSCYDPSGRQTMGEAAVSFLLRPCAFLGLVVFGRREENTPTFTGFCRWMGRAPVPDPQGERELVRRFLRCYGPATQRDLAQWLGASPRQAKRLWDGVAEELAPVSLEGRKAFCLEEDLPLFAQGEEGNQLLLLGAHDPYLDGGNRDLLLPDKALQRQVWRTGANPGAVLRGGQVAGIWKSRSQRGKLALEVLPFVPLSPEEKRRLEKLGEAYGVFRQEPLTRFHFQEE